MLTLTEKLPKKVTGLTSLFLDMDRTYPRDEFKQITSILKGCNTYNYSAKTEQWELPIYDIAYLVDNLSMIDDVKVIPYKETINLEIEAKPFDQSGYKFKLFKHQVDAINFGLTHPKWLLLDDCGLGKTISSLYLAEELYRRGQIEHCLIICGFNSLKMNWLKEIEKASNLSGKVIGAYYTKNGTLRYKTIKERAEQLKNKIDEFFVIINIEMVREDIIVDAILKSQNKFDMIILDEAHLIKNLATGQASNLLKIKAPYMLGMTGSLLVNSPLDLLTPLSWIGVEHSTIENFERFYMWKDEMKGEYYGVKNLNILHSLLFTFSLRRLKKDVLDLPPKTIINEYVELSDEHMKLNTEVIKGIKNEIDKVRLSKGSFRSKVVRLKQVTSCPSVLTTKNIKSNKENRCISLVNDFVVNGEKVVIFSGFKQTVYDLEEKLKDYNPLVLTGDSKDGDVTTFIDMFQNDDIHKVMIVTYQKLGVGHTLNRASYAIFMDTPWTNSDFTQACDRIYRIGTTKPVFIYNLIALNTVDELVKKLVDSKRELSKLTLGDTEDETLNIIDGSLNNEDEFAFNEFEKFLDNF